ncbi:MAG: hypothetical protein ACPL3C_09220 [Pyrobaculum sp.]
MEFPKVLVIRHFTEVLGMRYTGEQGEVLWFEDGLNKVAVGLYLSELYEEGELYKRVAALAGLEASKVYLAVLPEGAVFVDPRFFKSQGVGLVVMDSSRGVDGVEVKIYAKARQLQAASVDAGRLAEAVKASVAEYLREQLKALEASITEKVKRYVDQRLEEFRRAAPSAQEPPRAVQEAGGPAVLDNEWVRILRSRGR